MLSQPKLWAALSIFLILAGCAQETPLKPYDLDSEKQLLQAASRFQSIDDFNIGVGRTKVDTLWETEATNPAAIKASSARVNGLNSEGKSVALQYTIPSGGSVKFFAALEGLDVSQAKAMTMLIRSKDVAAFAGQISIGLWDRVGAGKSVDMKRYRRRGGELVQNGWEEVVIPRSAYQGVDFDVLDRLEILIASKRGASGRLVLDEVAFFGDEDIVFRSGRDNLVGFPEEVVASNRRAALLKIEDDRQLLKEIATDTWRYFDHLVDHETGLAVDHIRVGRTTGVGSYASPTNVGLHWLTAIAALDLSLISEDQAIELIRKSLNTFKKLKRWKNRYWYNFYNTHHLQVTREYISAVDNGWLAAALVVLRQAFPDEFGQEATQLLEELDFSEFYDPSNGQIRIGFDVEKGVFEPYHYGLLATEARIVSYVAIGKGDVDEEHWARIYRTLPVEWDWQRQSPDGFEDTLFKVPLFEGHYTYLGREVVPSWGGSLFEFLAPIMVVDEQKFASKNLGRNNKIVTELHIEHAMSKKGYPIWGIAPCAIQSGDGWSYREYGVPELGAKGYRDEGVIAPYASFLALEVKPDAVILNVREMLSRYEDVYGGYGFYDSVHVLEDRVNYQYLMLDQAMIFLSIANYLRDGAIRNLFHADPIGKRVEKLLAKEEFSIH